MNQLLEQFISESREALQDIGAKLMELEREPAGAQLITELFRLVHTLKGNSGLFEFPELTRVLHAGEDLMDAVRDGRLPYSLPLADRLLDAMDFVGLLLDEIEKTGAYLPDQVADSLRLAQTLRELLGEPEAGAAAAEPAAGALQTDGEHGGARELLSLIPQEVRSRVQRDAPEGAPLHLLAFSPTEECFFQGDDPFFQARHTPGLLWGGISARKPWPGLAELDAYSCQIDFHVLSSAPRAEITEYYRYVADQLRCLPVAPQELLGGFGAPGQGLAGPQGFQEPGGAGEAAEAAAHIIAVQREVLALPEDVAWWSGRTKGAVAALSGCLSATCCHAALADLASAAESSLEGRSSEPLLAWLDRHFPQARESATGSPREEGAACAAPPPGSGAPAPSAAAGGTPEGEVKFGRRAEDAYAGPRSIKVDQEKIDRLMNLIGEMVVAKNALPYLAARAEAVYGTRELSREIKAQYAVINRIAQEMQDSIMQVRMMPVSFVFQRFPRLVRDTANKLGKKVNLVLEGEEAEADKNIIEALGDPLVHIVRNSLDHGIESPEVRVAAGKPATGALTIRARQESDRVVIEVEDDGKGIDPEAVKRKAYEKGLIDEEHLERISDQEAVNLVFTAGFSTAETVSDLSGRGVGMDVVRTAIEKVNGTVQLESRKGRGTRLSISLPLSMAVTSVMIVESGDQVFGVPMDAVLETVRVPRSQIRTIKKSMATVLRGRIVPLKSLNALLGSDAPQKANEEDELAVLVVSLAGESVGILVDDFHETVEIILKPMAGVLSDLSAYAGSALLGDGSVLIVLNVKEML